MTALRAGHGTPRCSHHSATSTAAVAAPASSRSSSPAAAPLAGGVVCVDKRVEYLRTGSRGLVPRDRSCQAGRYQCAPSTGYQAGCCVRNSFRSRRRHDGTGVSFEHGLSSLVALADRGHDEVHSVPDRILGVCSSARQTAARDRRGRGTNHIRSGVLYGRAMEVTKPLY